MRHLGLLGCALFAVACGGGGGGGGFRFTSTPSTSTAIRAPWTYQATTAGAGGTVGYLLVQAPAGATVSATGTVSWTPGYADLGMHSFLLRATDPGGHVDQSFELRVHQGIELGVALSPRGHTSGSTDQDYVDHLDPASPHGRLRAFHSAWRDSVVDAGQLPQLLQTANGFVATYGFIPGFVIGWADGTGNPDLTSETEPANNSWSNQETRSEFLTMVTEFVQAAQPPFLMLGNEVNSYWNTHTSQEWADWISEYETCYDAVEAASPQTRVGMVFQLELLKGLGGNTGWSYPPQWAVVDGLVAGGRLDVLSFTSYPYLHYDQLVDVPGDYYDEISAHWTGPVAFTEIGWLAAPHVPYPGNESEQADFVDQFFALTDDLDLVYVAWLFLHDWDGQATLPAFADIGFRNNDASVIRLSDAVWQAAVALRQK